jgi:hypothetical protein
VDLLLALVGVLAVLHVLYATWTAKRLDRLHARVDAATTALDGQLRQRSTASLEFATSSRHANARELAQAARTAMACPGLGHDREVVESALSRALQAVAEDAGPALVDVAMRTGFARRFHNDAVRDALVVRRRRIVRWFRLAGSARLPSFFEMDETSFERRTIEV